MPDRKQLLFAFVGFFAVGFVGSLVSVVGYGMVVYLRKPESRVLSQSVPEREREAAPLQESHKATLAPVQEKQEPSREQPKLVPLESATVTDKKSEIFPGTLEIGQRGRFGTADRALLDFKIQRVVSPTEAIVCCVTRSGRTSPDFVVSNVATFGWTDGKFVHLDGYVFTVSTRMDEFKTMFLLRAVAK